MQAQRSGCPAREQRGERCRRGTRHRPSAGRFVPPHFDNASGFRRTGGHMNDPLVLAIVVIVALGGLAAGFVARGLIANQSIKAAQDKSARIVAEARTQQKELILQAKDEQVRIQRETEEEARSKRNDLAGLERRLLQRDEQLDQRTDMLEERTRKLTTREQELDSQREALAKARTEQLAALEQVAQMSVDEAKGVLLEQVREDAEHDAVR